MMGLNGSTTLHRLMYRRQCGARYLVQERLIMYNRLANVHNRFELRAPGLVEIIMERAKEIWPDKE